MLVLGLDASSAKLSVGLVDDERTLAEATVELQLSRSEVLLQTLETCLAWAQVKWQDLDGLAVPVGPGSFTGLRIAMATVKGLAYALGKPVVTCTTFEAIASGFRGISRPLVVLFPAPKETVLVAVYESENGMMHPTLAPQICALDNVTMLFPYGALVTGPGAVRYRNRLEKEYGGSFQLTFESDSFVRGVEVARLGLKRLQAGEVADLAWLEPQYFFAWGSGDAGNA